MDDFAALRESLADRYRIERELGHGGMATVYLAHDLRHDRPVALKVLHAHLGHALGPERFQREIRLAARLQHPHVLSVHDSGEAAGRLWFTMPFVEGESLRERLNREKQLPVEDAVRIAAQAADALEYAHRHGVIHRDIKPENIMLQGGHALVADFGIARAVAAGTADEQLTSTGMSIGTAAYMSPEQAAGEAGVDARSDIYSLATVLFEMLTGEVPFAARTPQAMIARRFMETAKPVRELRETVPPAVEAAVAKALARVPADRFATATAFGTALSAAPVQPVQPVPPVQSTSPVSPASRPPAEPPVPRRRIPVGFTTLAVGFILGLGLLFAWNRNRGTSGDEDSPLIAVLPFENAGDSADAYFADGMTEEVRGRLAKLPGLRVVASGSTREYRETTKTLPQIGRELGAQYLLTATVRWAKAADGTSRVRVSPELVRIGGNNATTEWQQPFDAALTDVFQVQADISERVAKALDLALGAEQHRQLAERPTKSLAAYDFYLRALSEVGGDVPAVRRRAALLEQAVAADPEFTEAWRDLSRANSSLYSNASPDPAVGERAKQAAERALALDPDGPHGHAAMAHYYASVRKDYQSAKRSIDKSLAVSPNDFMLLRSASSIAQSLGDWNGSLEKLQAARRLDPRSIRPISALQLAFLWLRRYPEALAASDSTLALAPGDLSFVQDRSMVFAAQGNLAGVREAMKLISPAVKPMELVTFFGLYWDMYWVLDEAGQQLLMTSRPDDYPDRESWATVLMQLYAMRGDTARTRAFADTALMANAEILKGAPDDGQRLIFRGLQLAYLGRRAESIAAIERGMRLYPIERDRTNGPYYQQLAARAYLLLGDQERALNLLEPLLKMPFFLSPGWLRIDPEFAALRGNPRFQRMIAGS